MHEQVPDDLTLQILFFDFFVLNHLVDFFHVELEVIKDDLEKALLALQMIDDVCQRLVFWMLSRRVTGVAEDTIQGFKHKVTVLVLFQLVDKSVHKVELVIKE